MKDLPRPFIYRDRKDIDEFLDDNPLWSDLYGILIPLTNDQYNYNVEPLTFFNEAYYQCVRIVQDKHPEINIEDKYLNASFETFDSVYSRDLCFSMIYAILSLQNHSKMPKPVDWFLSLLSSEYLEKDTCYYPSFKEFVKDCRKNGKLYDIDLQPHPIPAADFEEEELVYSPLDRTNHYQPKYDFVWWKRETYDFDQKRIREIVNLWSSKEDQLKAVDIIERAFDVFNKEKKQNPYVDWDLPF